MKTALDIINEKTDLMVSNFDKAYEQGDVLAAMEEYADQFKPQWIPVSERLPDLTVNNGKASEEVIVLIDSVTYIGYYTTDGWCYSFGDLMENPFFKKLTHWSPIPKLP